MVNEYSRNRLRKLTYHLCCTLKDTDIIYRHRNRVVIRSPDVEHGTVIIKMYARPDWKGRIRRWTRSGSCDHEWRGLMDFERIGVRVPKPLGHCFIPENPQGFTDAIAMEDLGECVSATGHLKQLIKEKRESDHIEFDSQLIALTKNIIDGGFADTDHSLVNALVRADGEVCRLDVELARRVYSRTLAWRSYGRMFGRLLASYTYAVQPNVGVVESFAIRIKASVHPSQRVWCFANEIIRRAMMRQYHQIGLMTKFTLP